MFPLFVCSLSLPPPPFPEGTLASQDGHNCLRISLKVVHPVHVRWGDECCKQYAECRKANTQWCGFLRRYNNSLNEPQKPHPLCTERKESSTGPTTGKAWNCDIHTAVLQIAIILSFTFLKTQASARS